MRTATLLLSVTLSLSLLAGCAPRAACPADKVPGLQPLGEDQGRIIFYTMPRKRHPAWKPVITLDGEKVGQATPGGYFDVIRSPGDYAVGHLVTTTAKGTRGELDERSRKLIPLKARETLYVQMVLTPGAGMEPGAGRYEPRYLRAVLVEPVQALKDIERCRYTGSEITCEEAETPNPVAP